MKFDIPRTECPYCHETLSWAMRDAKGDPIPPRPGDFAICTYCEGLSVHKRDLALRKPTKNERFEAFGMPEVIDLQIEVANERGLLQSN